MEANYLNFGDRSLPHFLGYGILDIESVSFKENVLRANYLLDHDNSLVYKVIWDEKRCALEVVTKPNILCEYYGPTLKDALAVSLLTENLQKDGIYLSLIQTIEALGNIYMQKPGEEAVKERLFFYPAGSMFIFRVPVLGFSSPLLKFCRKIKKLDYILDKNTRYVTLYTGKGRIKPRRSRFDVYEYEVPIAYLTRVAKLVMHMNIIEPEKQYQLMIHGIEQDGIDFQFFKGDRNCPYFMYEFFDAPFFVNIVDYYGFLIEEAKNTDRNVPYTRMVQYGVNG